MVDHKDCKEQLSQDVNADIDGGIILRLRIGGEDGHQTGSRQLHDDHQHHRDTQGDGDGTMNHLANPVIILGAGALRHNPADGTVHGGAEQLCQLGDLHGDTAGGGDVDVVGVDQGGDHDPSDADHAHLDSTGQPHLEYTLHLIPLQLQRLDAQAEQLLLPPQVEDGQDGADDLGDDSSPSGAGHAHVKTGHEHQVQDDIQDHADRHTDKGTFGVPHRPQSGTGSVIDGDKEHPHGTDAQILLGLFQRRRIHPDHDLVCHQEEDNGDAQTDEQTHGEQGAGGLLALLFLLRAIVLADEHAAADGDADDDLGEQVDDGGAVADGGLGIRGAAVVACDNHISDVIGGLQKVGDHKGACVAQEHTGDVALGEVVLTGHFIRSFLSENFGRHPIGKSRVRYGTRLSLSENGSSMASQRKVSQSSGIFDAEKKCNLKKLAACTSVFSLLRLVSLRAQRVHAPGCNLRQNACILANAYSSSISMIVPFSSSPRRSVPARYQPFSSFSKVVFAHRKVLGRSMSG